MEIIMENSPNNTFKVSAWGVRHNQCVLLSITFIISYSIRACMGIAMVAMVYPVLTHNQNVTNTTECRNYTNVKSVGDLNNTVKRERKVSTMESYSDFDSHGFFNAILLKPPFPKFSWSKKIQDVVLSSFFWGYMILQIPAGYLAYKVGARYLLVGAMAANSLFLFLIPLAAAYGGWAGAAVCRLAQGLAQSFVMSSLHTILGKWSPIEERGRLSGIIYGGQALGTMLGLLVTGFIATSAWGWPGIFHFYGILAALTAVLLWCLLANTPAQHKTISASERSYIEEALRQTDQKRYAAVPWKSILKNPGMIAIIVNHIGHATGQAILYVEVPAYMASIVRVDIKANGLLTSFPYFSGWVANFFYSWLSDMLVVKKYLTITQTRKLMNTIGFVPVAFGFVALGYAPNNIYIVESLLVFIACFKIATHFGFYVNHIDISPNYAGAMMGISNFCANLVASLAPVVTGAILTADVTDARLWRIVFFITGGMNFFANVVYLIWGTGEQADWNDPPQYEKVALTENKKRDNNLDDSYDGNINRHHLHYQ